MMKYKSILIILCLALISFSCRKEEKSVLVGCCGKPAIDESFGNGHIYVPNIFTPDGDNINDHMWVAGDSIARIIHMEIKTQDGQVVFEASDILSNNFSSWWNGEVDGVVQKGLYSVVLNVEASDGTIAVLEGDVCNYPCGNLDDAELISIMNCQFGDQVDANYQFDPTIPTAENFQDCFN